MTNPRARDNGTIRTEEKQPPPLSAGRPGRHRCPRGRLGRATPAPAPAHRLALARHRWRRSPQRLGHHRPRRHGRHRGAAQRDGAGRQHRLAHAAGRGTRCAPVERAHHPGPDRQDLQQPRSHSRKPALSSGRHRQRQGRRALGAGQGRARAGHHDDGRFEQRERRLGADARRPAGLSPTRAASAPPMAAWPPGPPHRVSISGRATCA